MTWHVSLQVGAVDEFNPGLFPSLHLSLEKPGSPYHVRNRAVEEIYKAGLQLDDLLIDLLHFAMAVYATDVRIKRSTAEDQWNRDIILYAPVADPDRWQISAPLLARMLGFLTGDQWDFQFRKRRDLKAPKIHSFAGEPLAAVSLFSGGLDSFVGAIDLLERQSGRVALVGQYGTGSTHPSQRDAQNVIDKAFGGRTLPLWFYVQPKRLSGQVAEDTMRSRSILFLGIGTAVAAAGGSERSLYIPENGLISLNVPLTFARMGSLSTRTTHPHFLKLYEDVLSALGIPTRLQIPYRFRTKGEMLRDTTNQSVLRAGLPRTLSCARPDSGRYQSRAPGTHCGYCVPCIIRLASMHAAGFDLTGAAYRDVRTDPAESHTSQGRDVRAFTMAIQRVTGMDSLQLASEVLSSGPLPPSEVPQYADLYKRGVLEIRDFLKG